MLLRKTVIRKAYSLVVGYVPQLSQFLFKLRATCGTGLLVPAYLVYLVIISLKNAALDFSSQVQAQ